MRVVRELRTPNSFQEFLQVAQNIYLRECKLVFDNGASGFKTNQNTKMQQAPVPNSQQYNSIMVQNKQ